MITKEQRVAILATLENTEQYRGRRDVKSESSGKVYRVSVRNSDGRWCCSCIGWTRTANKNGNDCKHIRAVKALCGVGVSAASLSGSDVVLALKMLLQDCATIAADEVLSRWLRMQETALNMLTYMSLCDDAEASQSYDTLFNSVRDKVIEAAMV